MLTKSRSFSGMNRFLVLIPIAVILICGSSFAQDDDPAKALLQTDREFSQMSADSGTAIAFNHYLAEDAIQLPTRSQPLIGRDAIYESM
jgi:hypothetical protein